MKLRIICHPKNECISSHLTLFSHFFPCFQINDLKNLISHRWSPTTWSTLNKTPKFFSSTLNTSATEKRTADEWSRVPFSLAMCAPSWRRHGLFIRMLMVVLFSLMFVIGTAASSDVSVRNVDLLWMVLKNNLFVVRGVKHKLWDPSYVLAFPSQFFVELVFSICFVVYLNLKKYLILCLDLLWRLYYYLNLT